MLAILGGALRGRPENGRQRPHREGCAFHRWRCALVLAGGGGIERGDVFHGRRGQNVRHRRRATRYLLVIYVSNLYIYSTLYLYVLQVKATVAAKSSAQCEKLLEKERKKQARRKEIDAALRDLGADDDLLALVTPGVLRAHTAEVDETGATSRRRKNVRRRPGKNTQKKKKSQKKRGGPFDRRRRSRGDGASGRSERLVRPGAGVRGVRGALRRARRGAGVGV